MLETTSGNVSVSAPPDFEAPNNSPCYMEIIGAVSQEESGGFFLQHFITRKLEGEVNLGLFEQMVCMQNEGKYQKLFLQEEFMA